MTAELSGRELDVAVARALGTYRDQCDGVMAEFHDGWICDGCGGVTGRWGDDLSAHPVVRRYSTDPATLDEMDEWLLQHCGRVDSLRYRSGCTAVARREDPHLVGLRVWQAAYGSTRNDAHARLVVAVKEAMGDG